VDITWTAPATHAFGVRCVSGLGIDYLGAELTSHRCWLAASATVLSVTSTQRNCFGTGLRQQGIGYGDRLFYAAGWRL